MSMLDVAVGAARAAGAVLLDAYQKPHQIMVKGLRDITTEADMEAERVTMETIRQGCPGAKFVTEESHHDVQEYGDAPTWYIDPLDGTTNYARGLPGFSVSVAMARNGVVQCGAVYDPLSDHLFSGERGGGAYLNGTRLAVSKVDQIDQAVVLLDWPRDQAIREEAANYLARLAPVVDTVRSKGSAALGICYVAAGFADAYYQYTLHPWDVAAGVLCVEEASGTITDMRGTPYNLLQKDWLVSNGPLHKAMLATKPLG